MAKSKVRPVMRGLVKAWSSSSYGLWKQCPAKYKFAKIDKLPEPSSPHLDKGNYWHQLSESYVSQAVAPIGYNEGPRPLSVTAQLEVAALGKLPRELEQFADEFVSLRQKKYTTEQMWCFKEDWTPTVWNDWNGVWARIKTDAHQVQNSTCIIVDYKTGKQYPDKHDEAMELYALGAFALYPQVQTVMTALWYLESGQDSIRTFKRTEVPVLKAKWAKRVEPMFEDMTFAPRPSNLCAWCHFRKDNAGPCSY